MASPGVELIPRAYQDEIFNHARRENIIAALDTGSGKTYISALLIRWLASQHSKTRKIYAFIVPRVPLVEQQREFLAGQVPLSVRGYYGALVDPWQHDPVRWAQEFDECDVMVMTAQIFLDAMLHAHWSMEQVALLVFDEAHHTRKNNPYNQIMRDFYYTCDPQHRPRVLGLTASPVMNIKNPLASIQALECNLHARVLGVQENTAELEEHSPRPIEIIQEYPVLVGDLGYPDYPTTLWEQIDVLDIHSHPVFSYDNLDTRYKVTLEEVGPYGADFYLSSYLQAALSDMRRKHRYEHLITRDGMSDMVDSLSLQDEESERMSIDSGSTDLSTMFTQIEGLLIKFRKLVSFEDSSVVLPQWICPKLRAVVSILLERRSSSFQGIIFVEQRQVAATLAWLLPRIPELKGWITAEALVGHGRARGTTSLSGMVDKKQREILRSFRKRSCNLLISTSVGEEGLDFQGCDLIVRYNELQNMVGYLQSRGRARRFDSTYIVMLPEGSDRRRYNAFRESEPVIRQFYQNHHNIGTSEITAMEEPDDPGDLIARERYEIPSTGAVLTFGSAISLLNNLCALIPRDKYTRVLQPQYTEENFHVTVFLPSALPIPRDHLVYHGPIRRTKREAKAAAAFMACKGLHTLGVFDDYLLPVRKTTGAKIEDADGGAIPEVGLVNEMMDVLVHDPWSAWQVPANDSPTGYHVWVHPLLLMGQTVAKIGLVILSALGDLPKVPCEGGDVHFMPPQQVYIHSYSELQVLQEFTALGIRWCNTSKTIKDPLTCLLSVLDSNGNPDLEQMREMLRNQTCKIGSEIRHEDEGHLLLWCTLEFGRPLLLRRLREDLNPLSRPSPLDGMGPSERFDTYEAYFQKQYGGKKYSVVIPHDGPLLLVETFTRNISSKYRFKEESTPATYKQPKKNLRLVPAELCGAFVFPEHVIQTFLHLPQVIRRITDLYRARSAVRKLGLPPLHEELVVEALTLPCASAGFNNQRLETLGDSILKLCVVVHLYNKYPFRHEGQLDSLRTNSVSNRVLLARAKEVGLERFLTSEPAVMRKWHPTSGDGRFVDGVWHAERKFARRSLQDCMEALLGASFLTGRIDMALQTGTALRLCFGGKEPWHTRYNVPSPLPATPMPLLFRNIQRTLGYEFKRHELLMEAITHPSFQSDDGTCYQRLEFLGDALLDVVVIEFLFRKFPMATSGQLTWAKSRAVMAPALATIAVKELSLEKYILFNSTELGKALTSAIPLHMNLSYEEVVLEGWKYDPPKALSDIMESVCGAMLIDSGYNFEQCKAKIERVMKPLLDVLRPDLPRDPTSELMLSLARKGCQRAKFEKFSNKPDENKHNDAIRFLVHGVSIGTAQRSVSNSLSKIKPLLAQRVKSQLEDVNSEFYLGRLCDCLSARTTTPLPEDIDRDKLDDEEEEGFAILGTLTMREVDGESEGLTGEEKEDLEGEEEVGDMLLTQQ